MIILVDTILYNVGERYDLPQCLNITLHSDILCIRWPSKILGLIPTSLARIQKTYFTHIGSKTMGLKWASHITQIWKFIYSQCLHLSKPKHTGEALYNHTRELIIDETISDKHKQNQYKLPYRYNSYFGTPLSNILETSISKRRKKVPPHKDRLIDDKKRRLHNLFSISTTPHMARYVIITLTFPIQLILHINILPYTQWLSLHWKEKNKW